jgi:hypothetical protein
MRVIPTRIHGMMDYLMGVLLIIAPWMLGLVRGPAVWVPVVLGAAAVSYSLMTDYELGAIRVIPMPVHLGLDAMSGLVLMASPWLFGFAGQVWVPHVVLGALELGAGLSSRTAPEPFLGGVPGG